MTTAKGINITLGTAGHIDHGKTALVKCLTGCDTDRLKIEKERGMSIELGFAPCIISGMEVGIVDVPGHEDFIKTMVAGVTGIDGVIFVIAADDGIMPQTREHLDIMTLLGVRYGIVALTKSDCVTQERLERATDEIRKFLAGTFLEKAAIVAVSNVTGAGFDELLEHLKVLIRQIEPRKTDGIFRLPVERTFSLKGYGTVVTGIPVSGCARTGDEIVILPQGQKGRIRAIQVFKHDSDTAQCGQCSAINVPHWDHRTVKRGDVAATEGFFRSEQWYLCSLEILSSHNKMVKNGMEVKFHTGTSEVAGKIYLLEANVVSPGGKCLAQLRLNEPIVAGPKDRFVVRGLSPTRTIGGGEIIEDVPAKLRRSRADVIESCRQLASAVKDIRDFVEYCVKKPKQIAADESELAFRTKLHVERLRRLLDELVTERKVTALTKRTYIHADTLSKLRDSIVAIIGMHHRDKPDRTGMSFTELSQASGIMQEVLAAVIDLLVREGAIRLVKEHLALPGYQPRFSQQQTKTMEAIESAYLRRFFNPPTLEEIAGLAGLSQDQLQGTLRTLVAQERLIEIEKGLFFHRDAVEQARSKIIRFIEEQGKLESVKFKYILDTTRKFAIPLLDYFDHIGLTYRDGYTRHLKKGG